jgi:N-acetylglucosamine-6-phosphate deacetylase
MAEAVRNAVVMAGIPLGDALRMATSTPANAARRPDIGRIAPGCRADFVMLDAEQRVLTVWQGGVAEAGGPASADSAKDQPG